MIYISYKYPVVSEKLNSKPNLVVFDGIFIEAPTQLQQTAPSSHLLVKT